MISLKDSLKKLYYRVTGKKTDKESISEIVNEMQKNYNGASTDYVERRINEEVASVYTYKGSVDTYSLLPTTGNKIGDVYNVVDTGKNYAWDGNSWDELGGRIALITSNITQLTTAQVQSLKCGDVVIKETGSQKHCYIVTYKEENVGICLTYTDANLVETVSYDFDGTSWVYNSTDSTRLRVSTTTETLTFTFDDDTTATLTVVTGVSFGN